MPTTQGAQSEYTIAIEYQDFLTRFDLDEILISIDQIIESEVLSRFDRRFGRSLYRYPYYRYRGEPDLSYIGITSVSRGSIVLTVVVSAAVATYVARRFKRGVDKSLLAEELERSGVLAGDVLGRVVKRINDWAARYVPTQRELGGNVRRITVQRKRKGTKRGGPKEP